MARDTLILAVAPALRSLVLGSIALLRCDRKDIPAVIESLTGWRRRS